MLQTIGIFRVESRIAAKVQGSFLGFLTEQFAICGVIDVEIHFPLIYFCGLEDRKILALIHVAMEKVIICPGLADQDQGGGKNSWCV